MANVLGQLHGPLGGSQSGFCQSKPSGSTPLRNSVAEQGFCSGYPYSNRDAAILSLEHMWSIYNNIYEQNTWSNEREKYMESQFILGATG